MGGGVPDPTIQSFFLNPKIRSDFASKSDIDLVGVGGALSTPLPFTSYNFTFRHFNFSTRQKWVVSHQNCKTDKSPLFRTNHLLFGQITSCSDKSPLVRTNHLFFGQITSFSDKSPLVRTNHLLFGQITSFSDKSPLVRTNHLLLMPKGFNMELHYMERVA